MFAYLVFTAETVYQVFLSPALRPPDSYLSETAETEAILTAIDEGYQWVRTEGPWAIFERPPLKTY